MKIVKILSVTTVAIAALVYLSYISISPADQDVLLLFEENSVVDFHIHVAGLGYGDSGCYINKETRDNFRFPFYLKAMGITEELLMEKGDTAIILVKPKLAVAGRSMFS